MISLLYALGAIILWASLAACAARLGHIPSFALLAMGFSGGWLLLIKNPTAAFKDLATLGVGILGYFFYHFFLFSAFRLAPAMEANLINYLWPMLIVMLTPLFVKEAKLCWYHGMGALLAFAGCYLLVVKESGGWELTSLSGHVLALLAALTWSVFTLTMQKLGKGNSSVIGASCVVSSLLCFAVHLLWEPDFQLQSSDYYWIMWMAIGPFALAFWLWDLAFKQGQSQAVGALAYLTPVLSTGLLILVQGTIPTLRTWWAIGLIMSGASCGLLDLRRSQKS